MRFTLPFNYDDKSGACELAVRELALNYPYLCQEIKYSKMVSDEKAKFFPLEKDKLKHKKIPVLRAGKIKMGQKFLMSCRFLERRVVTRNSLFNRQLTGKKQAFENFILWILKSCWKSIPLLRNICQKHAQFPTRDNRERTGKYQAAYKRIQGIAQYFYFT